jgi:lysozyme
MVANVRELLIRHEGCVPHAYQDSLGLWTIGVGHLIDQKKGGGLPQPIIDQLLDYDIDAHTRALFSDLPWVAQLDAVRQAVLIDMHFNLGNRLLDFKDTLQHVQRGEWAAAATAMHASRWAVQVGSRAIRLAGMMRTGEWPP